MQQCIFPSFCLTKDLWPDYPLVQNAFWNTWLWTVDTKLASATQRDWFSCKMISSTVGLKSFLHSHSIHSFYPPSRFPLGSLVLIQTTRHCNPSPSSLILTLLNMHPHSKARIPQVIIIPRHQPFISAFTKLLGQVAGVAEKFQQPAKFLSKTDIHTYLSPSLSVYHLFPFPFPSHHPTTNFCPLPALVPSTSPHQYSSIPHHHSRRLFPALHNTPTKRKASPCIVCSSNGEIPLFAAVMERFQLQKWRLIKQKANLKNMLCSHQWGDLLFGHNALKASAAVLSMWPCKNISHIQV